jgi:ppGpp synthetase/RelA/SpoT-type nucleotidyltranferase
MDQNSQMQDRQWADEQIRTYTAVYPRFACFAEILQKILQKGTRQIAPLAIIQTRPKSIPSFAEKAIRKKKAGRYSDPLAHMTDLCGGRVITQTLAEIQAIGDFIESHFVIDESNSVDVSQRLKPSEFGYRSVHYIIQFKRGVFPTKEIPVEIPEELYPDSSISMKAEIQVRTVLEHAWAGFVHDRVYKSAFTIPPKWERELAVLAGMLEQTDLSFSRIQSGLRTYAASYGAYLNEEQLKEEISILESVLTCDPENPDLAYRIGKLAMELGDWQKALDVFSKFAQTGYQPILRDLGVVLCKLNAGDPQGERYRQGQKYLEVASSPPYRDSDALASLAGTWKKLDEGKTRELYRQAFDVDPTDPYAVSNYLVYEIIHQNDLTPASLMAPSLAAAILRSRDQAEVGMNIPWAYYNLGIFHLLLGQLFDSLVAYAKAIQLTSSDWVIETSQRLLEKLSAVQEMRRSYEQVHRLLLLGRAVKYQDQASLEKVKSMATANSSPITAPVVIVAGATREDFPSEEYRSLLIDGFKRFHGTLVGGGTTAGISGLTGAVQAAYPGSIFTIGYVPRLTPAGTELDPRYRQHRMTEGQDFSALEPLQYWTDLIASGVSPAQIKLLGISGGEISAFEFRLALMLGCSVGVIETSGREAARLFKDPDWRNSGTLQRISPDPRELEAFLKKDW